MLAPAYSQPATRTTRVVEASLRNAIDLVATGLLIFAPLAFGAVDAWSQEIVLCGIGLLALLTIGRGITIGQRPQFGFVLLVVLSFIALVLFQLAVIPQSWIATLSPHTLAVKGELLHQLGQSPSADTALSFYPFATAWWLRVLLGVATLFCVVRQEYRDLPRITRLLTMITTAGVLVALLAVYQNLSRTTLIYGTMPMQHRNAGPFMNYSHFSQFMNLSIGAAVALLLIWSTELKSRFSLRSDVLMQLREPANYRLWLAMFLCVVGPVVVMLSMSRMGMLSMFAAAMITLGLLSWRTRSSGRGTWATLVVLCVLTVTLLTCYDLIAARLSTLQNHELASGTRLQILRDLKAMFIQFPLLGTGLGTHEFLFPKYSHLLVPQVVAHAENEFAEMMEECGLVGILLIAAYIGFVFRAYFKSIGKPSSPLQMAAFGLGFGWIAILIHSCSDFGQHTLAVAMLTSVVCALLLNIAATSQASLPLRPAAWPWRIGGGVVAGGIIVGLFAWIIPQADRARRAADQTEMAQDISDRLEANNWQGSDEDYRAMLGANVEAARLQPRDVKIAYALNAARWHTLARSVDAASNTVQLPAEAAAFVPQLKDAFEQTALLCPSYGPPLAMIGKLRLFFLQDTGGIDDIKAAYKLAPHDVSVCSLAAMLAAQQGNWQQSRELFQKSIQLGTSPQQAIDYYLALNAPQMAFELAQGNRERLKYLLSRSKENPALQRLADRCQKDSDELLEQEVRLSNPSPTAMAEYAHNLRGAGQFQQAADWYRKALDQDYGQINWRLELAQSLADTGQRDAALRELRICKNLSADAHVDAAIAQIKIRGSGVAEGAAVLSGAEPH